MSDTRERNKAVVERLFEIIYGTVDDLERLPDLVAEDYIQHNPNVPQGRHGLREFFADILSLPIGERLDPSRELEVNVVADGDFVVRQTVTEDGMLIDVFRLENGLLKEHWDAFRPRPGGAVLRGLE